MKAVPVLALVVAVAAAVVGVVALIAGDDGEELTLTFTEFTGSGVEFNPIGVIPEGQSDPGAGGGFATSIPLEDEGGEEAGTIEQICIFTKEGEGPGGEGREGTCLATAILPDGQLVLNLAGPLDEDSISGSIIGGTGDYTGAYGTYERTSGATSTDPATGTFEFTVP